MSFERLFVHIFFSISTALFYHSSKLLLLLLLPFTRSLMMLWLDNNPHVAAAGHLLCESGAEAATLSVITEINKQWLPHKVHHWFTQLNERSWKPAERQLQVSRLYQEQRESVCGWNICISAESLCLQELWLTATVYTPRTVGASIWVPRPLECSGLWIGSSGRSRGCKWEAGCEAWRPWGKRRWQSVWG